MKHSIVIGFLAALVGGASTAARAQDFWGYGGESHSSDTTIVADAPPDSAWADSTQPQEEINNYNTYNYVGIAPRYAWSITPGWYWRPRFSFAFGYGSRWYDPYWTGYDPYWYDPWTIGYGFMGCGYGYNSWYGYPYGHRYPFGGYAYGYYSGYYPGSPYIGRSLTHRGFGSTRTGGSPNYIGGRRAPSGGTGQPTGQTGRASGVGRTGIVATPSARAIGGSRARNTNATPVAGPSAVGTRGVSTTEEGTIRQTTPAVRAGAGTSRAVGPNRGVQYRSGARSADGARPNIGSDRRPQVDRPQRSEVRGDRQAGRAEQRESQRGGRVGASSPQRSEYSAPRSERSSGGGRGWGGGGSSGGRGWSGGGGGGGASHSGGGRGFGGRGR